MRALLMIIALALLGCQPLPPSPETSCRGAAIVLPPPPDPPEDLRGPRPDHATPPPDLAQPPPACGCLRPAVLGLAPLEVRAGTSATLQVWSAGGALAGLTMGDVIFSPGGVAVTGISTRSPDNIIVWVDVASPTPPALDLRVRGQQVLHDALLITP